MKNKGFTLMELLAVIIVLAIIALIATPIVTNVIEKSKESTVKESGKNLLNTVELYMVSSKKQSIKIDALDPNLNYNGKKPKSGTIEINKLGESRMYVYIEGYCVTKSYDGEISLSKKSEAECDSFPGILCESAIKRTTGNIPKGDFSYGDEYVCNLGSAKDTKNLIFFVIDKDDSNVSLIMNQNLGDPVGWCNDSTQCKINNEWDNSNGPIIATNALKSRTSTWVKLEENQITLPTYDQIYKAAGNKESSFPIWLYDYLDSTTHSVPGLYGYWTVNSYDKDLAWRVLRDGSFNGRIIYSTGDHGIRPVITISKTQLG